jgi:hypothetical protein
MKMVTALSAKNSVLSEGSQLKFFGAIVVCAVEFLEPGFATRSVAQDSIVLKNDGGYTLGHFRSELNPWGAGTLVAGRDYSQTMTIDPSAFPEHVHIEWDWNAAGSRVVSYPFVELSASTPTQTANITALDADYSVSIEGDLSQFSVAFEIWLANAPHGDFMTTTHEIMVIVHAPDKSSSGSVPYSLPKANLGSSTIYVDRNWGDPKWHQWCFVNIKISPDKLDGHIPFGLVIKDLIWRGIITGKEYLKSIQIGAEIFKGRGSFNLRKLQYKWAAKPTSVASSDLFRISSLGANHVVGTSNTVIYSGKFSEFDLRRSGGVSLVMKQGDLSTLDVLENVKFIRFDDGLVELESSNFRPSP